MKVSVFIKTYNEQANIARTIECAIQAIQGLNGEIIVADSLSSDATVQIALKYQVRVIQLENQNDRGCGAGAQLGYQSSRGEYVVAIDGDMELQREFVLEAIRLLDDDASVGGVGGRIQDLNFTNVEYKARKQRSQSNSNVDVKCLNGGGVFRRAAIESVGYFANRNLHAFEELEQGLRLVDRGWRLVRLPIVSVYHHGHVVSTASLLWARWVTKYAWGSGELVRASFGRPYMLEALDAVKVQICVVMWGCVAPLVVAVSLILDLQWVALTYFVLPPLLMLLKKRSFNLASYAIVSWLPVFLGTICGFVRPQLPPTTPLAAKEFGYE